MEPARLLSGDELRDEVGVVLINGRRIDYMSFIARNAHRLSAAASLTIRDDVSGITY